MTPTTHDVLELIAYERLAQDEKWGRQRHPSLPAYLADSEVYVRAIRNLADAEETRARHLVEGDAVGGNSNWLHVLDEEYKEMVAAAWGGDDRELRKELIQTAAVIVNWLETLHEGVEIEPPRKAMIGCRVCGGRFDPTTGVHDCKPVGVTPQG